jgi:type I restriction-modification system DNA methylase subunit
MDLIQQGIAQGLIRFDEDRKNIFYIHQNVRRNYTNPEEQVQVETFLKLVLKYKYPVERICQFVTVQMGVSKKQADIIVYNDDACLSPYIIVECKNREISDLEFKQAVDQAFSYAVAEGALYVWVTSGIADEYFSVDKGRTKARKTKTNIPKFGFDTTSEFNFIKGSHSDLEIVEQDDLTRVFRQAHNTLWGGGELNPSEAFDELDKLIFCKIWDEKYTAEGVHYEFQISEKENDAQVNQDLFTRIKRRYEEGRQQEMRKNKTGKSEIFSEDIKLSPEKLASVVKYLQKVNLNGTDLDSKGRAFETFLGSFFRGDFGQYFTPRPIVDFVVNVLPITNRSLVLDTSCGSGGFLLHALDKVRKQADVLYPNELATKDKPEGLNHYRHWHDFAEYNLYGIEINNQIARTAKMNMIIHDDGHTNVIAADGLLPPFDFPDPENDITIKEGLISKSGNAGFKYNHFDFIVTNPPFGSVIKQTERAYMHQYNLAMKQANWLDLNGKASARANQSTEVLFIEQCHKFLKADGFLAIVIPDGILTNSSSQYVRDDIEEKFRIIAVISLPQTAFMSTGAGVKSSVLFLRKYDSATTERIKSIKHDLQTNIKQQANYKAEIAKIEQAKKQHIEELRGFDNPEQLKAKALTELPAYKEWKKAVMDEYAEQITQLKEQLTEQYEEENRKALIDYPIFMAITEDIGYDATGKETNNNELKQITQDLRRFIEDVIAGKDSNFL